MAISTFFLLVLMFSYSFFFTNAIQSSQKQVLLQLRKQLEYPKQLDLWVNTNDDFCYLSSPQVNITCENNYVTELKIMGFSTDQQPKKVLSSFNGLPNPSHTLSQNFSMDSLIATLSRLTSLKVLKLVSLGIWGPLPDKIQRLYTIEYIDLSYNYLYGSFPPTFTRLTSLKSVNLDGNFFTVLGASYTFPSWKMNNVPHTTFLLTNVCFLFYHVTSNLTLRRLQHSVAHLPLKTQWIIKSAWILALSYFIAYLETVAISNFPYYSFVDRSLMYKVGSLFYAIYFLVSFPMFLRIDEEVGDMWDLPRVAVDSLGAAMLVTIILDMWRLILGPIVPIPDIKTCARPGLPWFPGHTEL